MKKLFAVILVFAMLATLLPASVLAEDSTVDFLVLSTTDMHGKCWDKNVLTDGNENNNMLRVATAVKQFRETFGENLLVIDNGDLYQGTPVSVVQLNKITAGESDLPAAMALCLAEIGYDVSVLGNHEFNYPWTTMSGIYSYLESRGVPVITANLYYDGTDGIHEKGENVFTPYLVKTVKIGETEHKIGVLGFENTDCTRWDIPDNYPGIVFAHPDNEKLSMAWEAQRYIPQMQAEGCEFIIVSYHSGTGSTNDELVFAQNTEGQVSRMIAECEGIDMVIAGHDHSSSYSNTFLKDKNGKDVLVVNGGGKDLTKTVLTFSEQEGKLAYTFKEKVNLSLATFSSDAALKEKIQPYADMAVEYVNQAAGTAVGEWDTSSNYYLQQTDTMDLINGAQIDYGTKYMAKKYDTDEKKAALYEATGLDHIEVDMSSTSAVTNNNYYVHPGPITMKTICQLYKYDNNVLYLLPLTGQQIKDILEQNASTRLKATVRNGAVVYSTIGEDFTNPVFGGLNFTYDMYQPEGSRAVITGFSNGRDFELDKTYVVACNSYHLGNAGCGFGKYTTTDSVWNQNDDLAGGNVQEVLLEYIRDKGEITTAPFTWEWKLDYTGDLNAPTTLVGDFAAGKNDTAEEGDQILICYAADGTVIGSDPAENDARLSAVDATFYKDYIAVSDKAAVFTVEDLKTENDQTTFLLKAEKGYLTAGATGNSLGFAAEATDCSRWYLVPVEGGFHIMNVGANYNGNYNQALEWYTGFTTYGVKDTPAYLFNLYKLVDAAKLASELTDGKKYVIYFDQDEFCIGTEENSGGLATVKNEVSGDFLLPPIAEETLIVTANIAEDGKIDFTTDDGKHLTAPLTGNGLSLTDELAADDCSLWTLTAVEGGWHVMNVGANYNGNYNQALEYYSGKFTTYGVKDTGAYLFNFYELAEEETPVGPVDPCEGGHHFAETMTISGNTRLDICIMLYQKAGCPEVTGTLDCEDADQIPDEYMPAAIWAIENQYIGYFSSPQLFKPFDIPTRAMAVTFFWNAAGKPDASVEGSPYPDVSSQWYAPPAIWAYTQDWIELNLDGEAFLPNYLLENADMTLFTCPDCGETTWKLTLARQHDWDWGRNIVEPTMAKDGVTEYHCRNCDAIKTEVAEKLCMNYYEEVFENEEDWSGRYVMGGYVIEYIPQYGDYYITGFNLFDPTVYPFVGYHANSNLNWDRTVPYVHSVSPGFAFDVTKTEEGDYLFYNAEHEHYLCCKDGKLQMIPKDTAEQSLYDARWKIVVDNYGYLHIIHENADGSFKVLYYDYTINSFVASDPTNPDTLERTNCIDAILFRNGDVCLNFVDIDPTMWYHDAIDFCIEEGLFSGVSDTKFEPDTVMSRAMLVSLLYRLEGSPEFTTDKSFSDVPDGQWFAKAVLWAAENNVVAGVGDGRFDPNGTITREQFASILYRYAKFKNCDVSASADLNAFPDVGKVSSWAAESLAWANAEGLISGALVNNVAYLQPQGGATRAQGASILMRFIQNVVRK